MAEAIVSTVIDQLASVIGKELEHEVRLVVGVRKEVKKLETKLTLIRAVLEDAEKKEIHENAVKIWLEDLKDVMYDADDVLDEWNTRILISRIEGFTADGSHVANKMCSYLLSPCACFKHGGARYDIAHRIIRERLAEVALTNKDQLHLLPSHSHAEPQQPPQFTSSIVDVSEVFGRNLDKQEILSMLLCETSQQETQVRIPILSIVGTGGFGKTTLAQLVYNEETITTTFKPKIWVCGSDPFDRERVAREIIAQATREKLPEDVVGWELLHQHLCNSVKGKRFLLVLDDVWTGDSGLWESLKLSLNGGERGSKIIITTRNEAVATTIGSIYIHRLAQLSDDGCLDLFRHIAFWGRTQQEQERLKGIGQEITKKCKGVPLAVKTLASLMQCKRAKEDWTDVLKSDVWETQEKGFLPALLLSYHALPSVLKRCFM
ncbi:hypothetical protein IFM89_024626 [Coptis chinensis]|uniref:Disease resistance protein RGA3 n=1 Tax=Coptis chinensis TaxID=261450 RepID=A0A835I365_9MAGN|nr:hypothetical protein IFM89_024626 [Coptis chinensis]